MKFTSVQLLVASALLLAAAGRASMVSVNSGSLGAAANGTHTPDVVLGLPGAVTAGGDLAAGYRGGGRTSVPHHPAINPVSSQPFTIEFWANPAANNPSATPLSNYAPPGFPNFYHSGWEFSQRIPTTGWQFIMEAGGNQPGYVLEGGTSALDTWSHVVAVWNGTSPVLYVNGTLADNTPTGSLFYAPNLAGAPFSVGSSRNGFNPFLGLVDEVAFYNTALTAAQIAAHFAAASSPTPGLYSSLVLNEGALLYFQNIPEPCAAALAALGLLWCGNLRRARPERRRPLRAQLDDMLQPAVRIE